MEEHIFSRKFKLGPNVLLCGDLLRELVNCARAHKNESITVKKDGRTADAKKYDEVSSIEISGGSTITILASGKNPAKAANDLTNLMKEMEQLASKEK